MENELIRSMPKHGSRRDGQYPHGSASEGWELLVVSAILPNGRRKDIDSSLLCPFICAEDWSIASTPTDPLSIAPTQRFTEGLTRGQIRPPSRPNRHPLVGVERLQGLLFCEGPRRPAGGAGYRAATPCGLSIQKYDVRDALSGARGSQATHGLSGRCDHPLSIAPTSVAGIRGVFVGGKPSFYGSAPRTPVRDILSRNLVPRPSVGVDCPHPETMRISEPAGPSIPPVNQGRLQSSTSKR